MKEIKRLLQIIVLLLVAQIAIEAGRTLTGTANAWNTTANQPVAVRIESYNRNLVRDPIPVQEIQRVR
jgi:hypothetical protein